MLIKHIGWKSMKNVDILQRNVIKRFLSVDVIKHYDIIIAGGGMIGTTLACTLGKNKKLSNKKILLLEGNKETQWKLSEKYSNRVSTLNIGTQKLLEGIDVWKHIESARLCPVKGMQVWEATSDALITFDEDHHNQGNIAFVVENDVLLGAVQKELLNACNVEVVYQSKIKGCNTPIEDGGNVQVHLDNGTSYSCNLLLGCDGANSLVRKSVGIHHISQSYNHMGVVATLKLQEDSENVTAWQRHIPHSQFVAILPLSKNLSSLVWSTTTERAKELVGLPEEQFVDALNDALWKEYPKSGVVEQATRAFDDFLKFMNLPSASNRQLPPKIIGLEDKSRAAFPLGFGHATNYIGKGVVLVGDAAHRIHPLAGQGVNLGFGDIVCLNKTLSDAVYAGNKIEDISYLKRYETERQRHNIPTMLAVHGLFWLYNTEITPLVLLRSLGLQSTHAISPLKKMIISQASA